MWPALISAGATLLGGLFGKKKELTTTTNSVDYKKMVTDAQAAGFNPLTVLRNGGAQGASVQSTATTGGGPSMGMLFADLAGSVSNAYFDSRDQKLGEIARMGQKTYNQLGTGRVSSLSTRPDRRHAYQAVLQKPALGRDKNPIRVGLNTNPKSISAVGDVGGLSRARPFELGYAPTVSNPYKKMLVDGSVSDAQSWETRGGDVVEKYAGMYVVAKDVLKNFKERPEQTAVFYEREVNGVLSDAKGALKFLFNRYGGKTGGDLSADASRGITDQVMRATDRRFYEQQKNRARRSYDNK